MHGDIVAREFKPVDDNVRKANSNIQYSFENGIIFILQKKLVLTMNPTNLTKDDHREISEGYIFSDVYLIRRRK